MKRVCVFGGSGFLGSHVADRLSESGYSVKIFDQEPSPWIRSDQEMIIGDLLCIEEVMDAVSDTQIVFNFAALADLNQGMSKPLETIRINVLGNANVLEACIAHKVTRFIYASTVYVHSRDGGFYRCSKQAAEQYVEEYQRAYGLDYTILRYGSLYGPRADKGNGLYRIVKNAVESGIVRYEGSAEALREYIHVEDAARASVIALGEEFKNEHVVLTGHEALKVIDMLKMLSEIMGIQKKVEFQNLPYAGHYVRTPYAYNTKLGRKFIPPMHVDLGQGLLQLIEEVKNVTS